ncbi:MAG TPA: zf-HC2 domain-containing protein [Verrucomicrobiae bacterium]|jgi:predicted anti-sigma-YlaC factor YlaD|nr:zf-HC2 domain-containing protein [Verrucomicrobiae bacterium]
MNHNSQEQLIDYLHHALAPEDDAAVYAHLENCSACRAAYQDEAALGEALRAQAAAEERDMPSGVVASIWAAIEASQRRATLADRLLAWMRPAVMVPVMAVVVVALLLVPHFTPSSPTQTIDAAYYLQAHAALGGTMPFADTDVVPASLENLGQGQTTAVAVTPTMVTADVQP